MSYEDLSYYEITAPINKNNITTTDINKIAKAWEQLECASVTLSDSKTQGPGFYLSCGKNGFNNCKKDNFWFHIHLTCDGIVILKNSKELSSGIENDDNRYFTPNHSKKTTLQEMANKCPDLVPFDANKFAALLYLWAGYNEKENCSMIKFIDGYKQFCNNLF